VFEFMKPKGVGLTAPSGEREILCEVSVPVNPKTAPLFERLGCEVRIDHDYIGHVRVESRGAGAVREAEFHNLDYGLALPRQGNPENYEPEQPTTPTKRGRSTLVGSARILGDAGSIALRPNSVISEDGRPCGREAVAGDLAYETWPEMFRSDRLEATPRQFDEHMYYVPCAICRRTLFQIEQEGLLLTCDPKVCASRKDHSTHIWGEVTPAVDRPSGTCGNKR
jgi:hypothetical protein